MKLGSSRLTNSAWCLLAAGVVAAACGSDSKHRTVMADEGGAGGQGGGSIAQAGQNEMPEPAAGAGGEPVAAAGGAGGEPPVTTGGLPTSEGGAPSAGAPAMGGEGGTGNELPPIDCGTIVFADLELEQAVREAILKPTGDITELDVVGLTDLYAYGVASIAGIECLSDLDSLELSVGGAQSTITQLAQLRYLTKLESLNLRSNPLEDLTPIGDLPNLTSLNLDDAIKGIDIAPLANLTQLTTLSMRNTTVDDVSPLGAIPTLVTLDMRTSQVGTPSTFSALTNVTELDVSVTLSDVSPLTGLTQLEILSFGGGGPPVTNLDQLSTLVNLTQLSASYSQLTSASGVQTMTKLTWLDLAFNSITDATPFTPLTQLTNLYLNYNLITNITPLVDNAGLGNGDLIMLSGLNLNCGGGEGAKVTTLIGRGATVYSPCN